MKAYNLYGIDDLRFEECELPQLHKGEVLVEVRAAGICASDIPRIFHTGTYHFPTIPGHEFSGRVERAFDSEGEAWIGKRVGVFPLIPCMKCDCCKNKQYEMCSHYNYLGSRCDGGFAEYVAVPIWNLIELPEGVSYVAAAMLEPAAVAMHALRKATGRSIGVMGCGTIGCILLQMLNANLKYHCEWATGHGEEVRKYVGGMSKDHPRYVDTRKSALDFNDRNNMVETVFDFIGTSDSFEQALQLVCPGGEIIVVGNPSDDIQLKKDIYWKLLRKQIQIKGTWNSRFSHNDEDDWHQVLELCAGHDIDLEQLITHRLPFDKLAEALDIKRNRQVYSNKVMVVRD